MKILKKAVGKRIKDRRKQMGFKTQAELAEKMEIDQSRVARWESGENLPDGAHRRRLLELLQMDEAALFGEIEAEAASPLATSMAQTIALQQAEIDSLRSALGKGTPLSSEKMELISEIVRMDEIRVKVLLRNLRALNQSESSTSVNQLIKRR